MTITLPIPSSKLSPNSRAHWRTKSPITKAARCRAKVEMLNQYLKAGLNKVPDFMGYRLAFYWPDKRRRDDDNAAGSVKAYRDGIADALGVDDHTLKFYGPPVMSYDKANPRLEIELF